MTEKDWRCRLGRHSYVGRREDNPELHGQPYQVCVRCGVRFEPTEEPQMDLDKIKGSNYFG